jgi:hypothetical protein
VQNPQVKVRLGEEATRVAGFGFTLGVQVDVVPTGEEIELVPLGTSVAQENEIGHVLIVVRSVDGSQFEPEIRAVQRVLTRFINNYERPYTFS